MLWSRMGKSTLPVRNRSHTAMSAGSAVNAIVSGSNAKLPCAYPKACASPNSAQAALADLLKTFDSLQANP